MDTLETKRSDLLSAIDARRVETPLRAPIPFDVYVRNNYSSSFLCNAPDSVNSDELLTVLDTYARHVGLGETLDYINDKSVDNHPNDFIDSIWQLNSSEIDAFERKLPEISSPIVAYRGYRTGIDSGVQVGLQDFGGRLRSLTLSQDFMNDFANKASFPSSIHTRVDILSGIEVLPLFHYSNPITEFEVVVKMGRLHVFKGDTVLEGRQQMLKLKIMSDCPIKTNVIHDVIYSLSYKYKFKREEAIALYGNLPTVREVISELANKYKKFTPQKAEEYYYGMLPLVDYYFIVSKPGTTVEYDPYYQTDARLSLTTGGKKTLLLNDQNALGVGNVLAIMDTFIRQRTQSKQLFPRGNKRPNRPTRRGGTNRKRTRRKTRS